MINASDFSSQLAIDTQATDQLRQQAKQDPQAGLQQAARQFESLFINMMLKSMRDATPKDGLMESDQTHFYTQMLDQQLAQNLSEQSIGLAEVIERQLAQVVDASEAEDNAVSRTEFLLKDIVGNDKEPLVSLSSAQLKDLPIQLWSNSSRRVTGSIFSGLSSTPIQSPSSQSAAFSGQPVTFVREMLPHARKISRETGIPEHFMIAQAALETGWGRHQIGKGGDVPSFNLFGIKAGSSWRGKTVEIMTTEYVDGKAQKQKDKFRAYSSYEEAFRDYARLLQNNPRYASVLKSRSATAFAWGLQQAGYATDPNYAKKLLQIINSDALNL